MILIRKKTVLCSIKIPINTMLFVAQNAGNHISELLDFKFFAGGMPQTPLGESSHSRLLHLQWPLITNVIETPVG